MTATGPPHFIRGRNAAATRSAILTAARLRFAQEGYDGASLRDIASDAGIDAALISRYFGSKDDLFLEALHACGQAEEFWQGDTGDFGRRVAHMLVMEPADDAKLDKLLIILRSASSPKAGEVIRRHGLENFYGPFETWLGGEDCAVRVRAAASIIMGFAVSRAIDNTYGLDKDEQERLCGRLADLLQRAIG